VEAKVCQLEDAVCGVMVQGLGVGVLGKAPWYHGAGNLAVCQSYQNVGFIKLRFWSLRTLH